MQKFNMDKWPIPVFLLIGVGFGLLTTQVFLFSLLGLGVGIIITFLIVKMK